MSKASKKVENTRDFDALVSRMVEAKQYIDGWTKELRKLEEQLTELFSTVDAASDFEGTESMESEAYRVKFIYKLTRKVDKDKALEEIHRLGVRPEELFIVKYDYSSQLYARLNDEQRNAVLDSLTTKRAKTSIEISNKEKDNG